MDWELLGTGFMTISIGFGIGMGTSIGINSCNSRSYSRTDVVQEGYVVPSKLEIDLIDLDGDGQRETTFKYEGKRYLLLQEEGRIKVQEYEIKPSE